jgi:hypothetical protein
LLGLGIATATALFLSVFLGEAPRFHLARDLELRAVVETYAKTGLIGVKSAGTGSWYTQIEDTQGLVPAAWDDDLGIYLAASLVSRMSETSDPYYGVTVVMATLIALPWVFIPLTGARLFRNFASGLLSPLVIPLIWLLHLDVRYFGTDYAVAVDSGVPVYGLYGAAGSVMVLTATLAFFASTIARPTARVVAIVFVTVVGATVTDFFRSGSHLPLIALGLVLVLTIKDFKRWTRLIVAAGMIVVSTAAFVGHRAYVDSARQEFLAERSAASGWEPKRPVWHGLYLGLAYEGGTLTSNPYGVPWSDDLVLNKVRARSPDVTWATKKYDRLVGEEYLKIVRRRPARVALTYLKKEFDLLMQHIIVIGGVVLVWVFAWKRRDMRATIARLAMCLAPGLVYGGLIAVAINPIRYYFVEWTASLHLLLLVLMTGAVSQLSRSDTAESWASGNA